MSDKTLRRLKWMLAAVAAFLGILAGTFLFLFISTWLIGPGLSVLLMLVLFVLYFLWRASEFEVG
jgi:hypothetical protein